ncbi:MAG: hypothetical protein S4CHLAM81_07160 [Chlamydiales bacterium]|nr:hypothetical protein [Chlamydiales bacterium]MCH9635500.1 hypothetical protein [Chlamydiales bacterium]MCH9703657.1 hypothetical protein [Chlamydiota bacterium]
MAQTESCASKPIHAAAYVVYNLGASVLLGVARAAISLVGLAYYSLFSKEAKLEQRAKIDAEHGRGAKAAAKRFFNWGAKKADRAESALNGKASASDAKRIFRSQLLRGAAEITVVGGWYYSYRDHLNYDGGLMGFGELQKAFDRLDRDIGT